MEYRIDREALAEFIAREVELVESLSIPKSNWFGSTRVLNSPHERGRCWLTVRSRKCPATSLKDKRHFNQPSGSYISYSRDGSLPNWRWDHRPVKELP